MHKPEPAKPAGMLPRCRWALSQESDPRHPVLKIYQLSSSWLSMAWISNQIEEESGEKNAGIIPGIGKRDALSGGLTALQRARYPVTLALQERGRVKVAKGFLSAAGEKLSETVSRGEVGIGNILTYGNSCAPSLCLSNEGASR